jgi:pimeloyl-ACP methyl ester carboxylesterase
VAPTMTVDRMTKDGVEIAEYLRKYLAKDKVLVVAHSFGTILALGMVRARPDLFYAYVGTGQVADEPKNYAAAYDALLQKAETTDNQLATNELKRVGAPPYNSGEGYGIQRKWSNKFEGADEFLNGTIGLALVAPGITLQDINDDTDGQILSGDRLFDQTRSAGPKELGLEFSVPMFCFEGDEDFTTPTGLAREYFRLIKAPLRQFVPIHGGHFVMFIHSDVFLRELIKRVRPIAIG